MSSNEPAIPSHILDALEEELKANARGYNNAITSSELAERIVDEDTEANPETREAIKILMRERDLPVIGGGNGYYIPLTPGHVDEAIETLNSRIAGIQERKQLLQENWENWELRRDVYEQQSETSDHKVETVNRQPETDGGDGQLTEEEVEFLENNPVSKEELLARRRGGV